MKDIEISVTGCGSLIAVWHLNDDAFKQMMADCLRFNRYVRVEVKGIGIMYINPAHIRYYKIR